MPLQSAKYLILIISILSANCGIGNEKTTNRTLNTEKEVTTSKLVKSEIIEAPKKKEECILNNEHFKIPKLREAIGDTINIKKVSNWISNLKVSKADKEIQKIINRRGKYFQFDETSKFKTIGILEDEGEYLSIYLFSIDKETCQILGKELIAETTGWENGYKETYSIFGDKFTIKRDKQTGAKDWGDGTKWMRDTIITMITFDEKGNINSEKK